MLRLFLSFVVTVVTLAGAVPVVDQATLPELHNLEPESVGPDIAAYKNYVSIGDSYAAGIHAIKNGALPRCNGANEPNCNQGICGKNRGAYSYLYYQEYKPNFTFIACSAAKTSDALENQVPKIPKDADLITVNIGGNNGGAFGRSVISCVYNPVGRSRHCAAALQNAANAIAKLPSELDSLFSVLRANHPSAKIVLLGYMKFWPKVYDPKLCSAHVLTWPTEQERQKMNALTDQMNSVLAKAASKHKIQFVNADSRYEGHRFCDKGPAAFFATVFDPRTGRRFDPERPEALETGDGHIAALPLPEFWELGGVFHPTAFGHQLYYQALKAGLGVRSDSVQDEL